MTIKRIYLFISFLITSTLIYGQWGDCTNSFDACSLPSFTVTPSGYGNTEEFTTSSTISNPQTNPNPSPGNMGCLQAGELNSTWLLITAVSNGSLEFSLGDNSGFNFYDWIMWPYNSNTCTDIYNNTLPPAACNWNGAGVSFTGMANPSNLPAGATSVNFENALTVNAGDQYILCFSNYSGAQTSVPLNFFGSANISCGTTTGDTICVGDTALITASDGSSYTWDNTVPGFISSTPNGDSAYVNPTVSTNYPVQITFSGGGALNDTAYVFVVDSTIVTTGPDTIVCYNEVLNLPATATNNGGVSLTYQWTPATGLSNPSTLNPSLTATADQTYYLTAYPTSFPQCIGNTDSIKITIDTSSLIPVMTGDTLACEGTNVSYEAHDALSYLWEDGQTDTTTTFIATTDTIVQVIATTSCGIDTLTTILTVVPTPSPLPSVPPNDSICPGDVIQLDAGGQINSPYLLSYTWNPSTGLSSSTVSNPTFSGSATTTYTLTVVTQNYPQCFTYTDSVKVYIDTTHILPSVVGDTIVCFGDQANLTASNALTYMWPDSSLGNSYSLLPSGDTLIMLFSTTRCFSDQTPIFIQVVPLPVTNSSPDTTIAVDNSVELYSSGGSSYEWQPFIGLNCNTCDTVTATPVETTTYYITISDSIGCKSYDTVTVSIEYFPYFLPNGFSPNNDNNNDILYVRGTGIQSIYLQIFDRYGNLMFETQDQNVGWDGSYQNKPVNTGVYIYKIQVFYKDGRTEQKSGNVTLFR